MFWEVWGFGSFGRPGKPWEALGGLEPLEALMGEGLGFLSQLPVGLGAPSLAGGISTAPGSLRLGLKV